MTKDEYLITDPPPQGFDCFCDAYDFRQLLSTSIQYG